MGTKSVFTLYIFSCVENSKVLVLIKYSRGSAHTVTQTQYNDNLQTCPLQKLAHAIFKESFNLSKTENFVRRTLKFLIFLLKTLIVGTCYVRVPTMYVLDQK